MDAISQESEEPAFKPVWALLCSATFQTLALSLS